MWGERADRSETICFSWNIPTRVGRTSGAYYNRFVVPEHPHACGENTDWSYGSSWLDGTSPRVWGEHLGNLSVVRLVRNIPTRVGRTLGNITKESTSLEHPHACGENVVCSMVGILPYGTSPRVWGERHAHAAEAAGERNIPTRVGRTWTATRPT